MKRYSKFICVFLTVALLLTGCSPAEEGTSAPEVNDQSNSETKKFEETIDWDAEYDVVVIGFGGAGASASIAAADAGSNVLLLEKAPQGEEGGNTRYAAQLVLSPKDREKALTYYDVLRGNFDNQSDEVIEFIVDGAMDNYDWLIELGADESKLTYYDYIEYPEYDGSDGISTLLVDGESWSGTFWKLLYDNVMQREDKIDVWYSSPAIQLIQDKETKIIHGVKVENDGKIYNVRAVNGVVMACGGFENNDEMLENYAQLSDAYSKGSKYNDGDGIKMAIDVGADLWHMSALSGPDVNFVNPETGISNGYYFTKTEPGKHATGFTANNVINVGGDGTRFMCETIEPRHGHVKLGGTYFSLLVPQNAWCVFDETARNAVPAYPSWSEGMTEEIEKGWIIKADTIEQLSGKMGIDAVSLAKTVTDFNSYCADGYDPDWQVEQEFLKPIETAPYYAFPIKATLTNTQGGAKRDVECQVLDVYGDPIPHLYSAGEFGSFFTDIYNGGGNLGECAFAGRTAGANAAQKKTDVIAPGVMEGKAHVDLSSPKVVDVTDGDNEYFGVGSGMGGDVTVKVTMDGDKISSVEVVSHHETIGIADRALEEIPTAIENEQNAEVDVVTGATLTSKAIMQAVEDALSKTK